MGLLSCISGSKQLSNSSSRSSRSREERGEREEAGSQRAEKGQQRHQHKMSSGGGDADGTEILSRSDSASMAQTLRAAISTRSSTFDPNSGHQVSKGFASMEFRMLCYIVAVCVLALLGLFLTMFCVENEYYRTDVSKSTLSATRAFVSFTTFVAILLHYFYFSLRYSYLRAAGQFFRKVPGVTDIADSFWSSGLFGEFLLEAFLLLIHLPPGMDFEVVGEADKLRQNSLGKQVPAEIKYSGTEYVSVIMLVRMVFLFRLVFHVSHISNNSARSLGAISYVKVGPTYALKAMLATRPIYTLFTFFITMLIGFSYAIRVLERPVEPAMDYYGSAMWLTVVTMTTLGYGDLSPNTTMGRFIMSIGVLVASICLSLVVVELRKQLSARTGNESRVLTKLDEVDKKIDYRDQAASVITRLYQMRRKNRKFKAGSDAAGSILTPLRDFKELRLTRESYEDENSEAHVHNRNMVVMGDIKKSLLDLDAEADQLLAEMSGTASE